MSLAVILHNFGKRKNQKELMRKTMLSENGRYIMYDIIECVIFKDTTKRFKEWVYDIADRFAEINTSLECRDHQYIQDNVFSTFGHDIKSIQKNIEDFKLAHPEIPTFDVDDKILDLQFLFRIFRNDIGYLLERSDSNMNIYKRVKSIMYDFIRYI